MERSVLLTPPQCWVELYMFCLYLASIILSCRKGLKINFLIQSNPVEKWKKKKDVFSVNFLSHGSMFCSLWFMAKLIEVQWATNQRKKLGLQFYQLWCWPWLVEIYICDKNQTRLNSMYNTHKFQITSCPVLQNHSSIFQFSFVLFFWCK